MQFFPISLWHGMAPAVGKGGLGKAGSIFAQILGRTKGVASLWDEMTRLREAGGIDDDLWQRLTDWKRAGEDGRLAAWLVQVCPGLVPQGLEMPLEADGQGLQEWLGAAADAAQRRAGVRGKGRGADVTLTGPGRPGSAAAARATVDAAPVAAGEGQTEGASPLALARRVAGQGERQDAPGAGGRGALQTAAGAPAGQGGAGRPDAAPGALGPQARPAARATVDAAPVAAGEGQTESASPLGMARRVAGHGEQQDALGAGGHGVVQTAAGAPIGQDGLGAAPRFDAGSRAFGPQAGAGLAEARPTLWQEASRVAAEAQAGRLEAGGREAAASRGQRSTLAGDGLPWAEVQDLAPQMVRSGRGQREGGGDEARDGLRGREGFSRRAAEALREVVAPQFQAEPPAVVLSPRAETLAPSIVHQTAQAVVRELSPGLKQLTVQIEPQDLGPIHVALQVRGGEVQAVLRPANPETGQILAAHLPTLRQELERQGFQVARLDVQAGLPDTSSQSAWDGAGQQGRQPDDGGPLWRRFAAPADPAAVLARNVQMEDRAAASPAILAAGAVDLFA